MLEISAAMHTFAGTTRSCSKLARWQAGRQDGKQGQSKHSKLGQANLHGIHHYAKACWGEPKLWQAFNMNNYTIDFIYFV